VPPGIADRCYLRALSVRFAIADPVVILRVGVSRVWEIVRENVRRYAAGDRMLSEVDVSRGY